MKVSDLSSASALHHAYIVAGSAEAGAGEVLATLDARGIQTKGNPDMLVLSSAELLVDEVRERILPFASLKPIGEKKYIILSFSRVNDSAQNALLKAVEESPGATVFFFCVDAVGHLLPTMRSRCVALQTANSHLQTKNDDAVEFVKESYEKRLARVEKMVSYITKNQDRAPARAFVKGLIESAPKRANPKVLRDLLDADRYLRLQGSSAKAILSHLAVSLPRS